MNVEYKTCIIREGGKCSQTTQLIRKMLCSNMKLHVSAYNGHRQVSIPIKGSLYIGIET